MNEIDTAFKEYLTAFKEMETPDKRQEIIHAINEITAIFDMLSNQSNIKPSYLKSNEIFDLKDGFETEDDYLEALLVYIENAKSVLGKYLAQIETEY